MTMIPRERVGTQTPYEWTPRLWEGCDLFAWLRLLARNKVAVQPSYWYIAAIVSGISLCHTVLRYLQESLFGSCLDRTPLRQPPLFILGHWRTGTTLLHELLIRDPRHGYPTYYQCLMPHHFLLTERFFRRPLSWVLPKRRPMDNMASGWDHPQEDEFALSLMGVPSPYLSIAFPNHPPQDQEALDLDGLSPRDCAKWKKGFLHFLHRVNFRDRRRLVLKSPTHTCRIPTLLELFPKAHFVHIVRNPYVVFSSTVNLWKTLYQKHGLQKPNFQGLEEHVFSTFSHLYDRLERTKHLIQPGHFHEIRYEDLTADPKGQLGLLYERLGLGQFDAVWPHIAGYFRQNANYIPNRYPRLDDEQHAEITRRWAPVINRYGY
jgi:hypothetical protein